MERRVAIVGTGFVTPFGETWDENYKGLKKLKNAVHVNADFKKVSGLKTALCTSCDKFIIPEHYTRKKIRSMSRVSLLATRSCELALIEAGLLNDAALSGGRFGVAFGSSFGSIEATSDFASVLNNHTTEDLNSNSYIKMMPHTTVVNVALFFGINGRIIPCSTACTSGSMSIGSAYECIKFGLEDYMLAGGAEELSVCDAGVFDTLYATSIKNDTPLLTPAPFDKDRDGLVIGEGAGAVVLEEYEHAVARGAKILGEIVGYNTNNDATHITSPNENTIRICMEGCLGSAHLSADAIGYISAHGTATSKGDVAESRATYSVFKHNTPISSLKSYFGHTLGACGAIEAIFALNMMKEGAFHPNLNLKNVDEECGDLNYITGDMMPIDCEYVMSNNFAFGGVNTSLILKRV